MDGYSDNMYIKLELVNDYNNLICIYNDFSCECNINILCKCYGLSQEETDRLKTYLIIFKEFKSDNVLFSDELRESITAFIHPIYYNEYYGVYTQ